MTDWSRLRGMSCTCPPGCTTGGTWGDGTRACAGTCEPCRLMAGQPYSKPPKSKTINKENSDGHIDQDPHEADDEDDDTTPAQASFFDEDDDTAA